MGDVFGKPAIVTDTHCIRLSNRIGLVHDLKDPKKVEMELWKIILRKKAMISATGWSITAGKYVLPVQLHTVTNAVSMISVKRTGYKSENFYYPIRFQKPLLRIPPLNSRTGFCQI